MFLKQTTIKKKTTHTFPNNSLSVFKFTILKIHLSRTPAFPSKYLVSSQKRGTFTGGGSSKFFHTALETVQEEHFFMVMKTAGTSPVSAHFLIHTKQSNRFRHHAPTVSSLVLSL